MVTEEEDSIDDWQKAGLALLTFSLFSFFFMIATQIKLMSPKILGVGKAAYRT
jgi:hypothetical protein